MVRNLPKIGVLFVAALTVSYVAVGEDGSPGTTGPDVWPDSCSCEVTFDRTFSGNYRPGEPYDVITARPDGAGETLADIGVRIDVTVRNYQGVPIARLPPTDVALWSPSLCFCAGSIHADAVTDENGKTSFTGAFAAGGCAPSLDVYAEGRWICNVPVKVNSPDVGGATSPCHTDASDLAEFAARFGDPDRWDICFDFNESGPPTINASDLAGFAAALGSRCQ